MITAVQRQRKGQTLEGLYDSNTGWHDEEIYEICKREG